MATRSFHTSPQSASFDIDVDTDLDLDATTPIRSFDVRAAFDWDQTVANPDHALITAERERFDRDTARTPSPPPHRARKTLRRSSPSVTHPESLGSLAPTAMELPESYFPSFPKPSNGIMAAPLGSVSTTPRMEILYDDAVSARRGMSPAKIAMMFGALAFAAALVAFAAAAMGADSRTDLAAHPAATNAASHNGAAPQQPETTSIPVGREPRAAALAPEAAQLFAPPSDPNADWRARLMQNRPSATDGAEAKAQR